MSGPLMGTESSSLRGSRATASLTAGPIKYAPRIIHCPDVEIDYFCGQSSATPEMKLRFEAGVGKTLQNFLLRK